jgi:GNAT superfamily N-acetyltransferase
MLPFWDDSSPGPLPQWPCDELNRAMIRSASPADLDALIDLSRRTIRTCYAPFLGDESVEAYIGSGAVESFIEESIDRTHVILCDDQLAGYTSSKDDLLAVMLVDHTMHRRGLGRALLECVERELFGRHETIKLESFEDNAVANAFYTAHGWHEAGRHTDPDYGIRMIMMHKSRAHTDE